MTFVFIPYDEGYELNDENWFIPCDDSYKSRAVKLRYAKDDDYGKMNEIDLFDLTGL